MGKPAARVGNMHECSMTDPVTGTPHQGGVIIGPGNGTVLIGGMPAATVGDTCFCIIGGPDTIISGSAGVFIGGKPAARVDDGCAHGGKVTSGLGSVLIGERGGTNYFQEPSIKEIEPVINQAILECIAMLERKLKLMLTNDPKTIEDLKEWFGYIDEQRRQIIINRIERALAITQSLTINDFEFIADELARTNLLAIANIWDEFHTIYLGDQFGKLKDDDTQENTEILIHEISHFLDVGHTIDFDYGKEQCLFLAKNHSTQAFYNADNFMYFIKA
ncbi:PAAR domain-containing protein [Niastella sp. OAS944]|uniref:PAAR domain-containing protein n=1 Tax=Niastella sp. OAS944 TaxID=2664089 RepID=UPI00347BAF0F|nr:putative Zn-binding protein involved in type VI secretion [Chitinophagaceae bacterium OAS944]